jgi:uncharacterized protein YjbI with pentapeptide repeats
VAEKQREYIDLSDIKPKNVLVRMLRESQSELKGLSVVLVDVDLRGANLEHVQLPGAVIRNSDLTGANLIYSNLYRADLSLSSLRDSRLHYAGLERATLIGTDLTGADMYKCMAEAALFDHATLRNVDVMSAKLNLALLNSVDMRGIKNLENCAGIDFVKIINPIITVEEMDALQHLARRSGNTDMEMIVLNK